MVWILDSRHVRQSKYIVLHEESDVQVKNKRFLRPEGKNKENRNSNNSCFSSCFIFFKHRFMGLSLVHTVIFPGFSQEHSETCPGNVFWSRRKAGAYSETGSEVFPRNKGTVDSFLFALVSNCPRKFPDFFLKQSEKLLPVIRKARKKKH